MFDDFSRKIYIKFGPVKMFWNIFLNVENLAERRIEKPWKVVVRYEQFFPTGQKPNAMI